MRNPFNAFGIGKLFSLTKRRWRFDYRLAWEKYIWPNNAIRLINITTFLSAVVLLLSMVLFALSNNTNGVHFEIQRTSQLLNAFIAKNDILAEFEKGGARVSQDMLRQWAYHFVILRDGNSENKQDYESVDTAAEYNILLATKPDIVDEINSDLALLHDRLRMLSQWQNRIFLISILIQGINTIHIFRLAKNTLGDTKI